MISLKVLILWFIANTLIGGILGHIISLFLTGQIMGQIILMSVLFGNVVGFASGLSALYILPLYRSLPLSLDLVLRVVTLLAGGCIVMVLVVVANPGFAVVERKFVLFMIALYSLIALVVGLIIYFYERMSEELKQSHMELEIRRDIEERLKELTAFSELQALKAQINPHFLFNTLNTIAALIPVDPEKAEATVHDMADLFRYTLDTAERQFVALSEELHFLDRYLSIEKVRFGDRLRVERAIDPESMRAKIPPLILQPIVENALRHGISRRKKGGTITIMATCDDEACEVRISDDGPGIPEEKLKEVLHSGHGLSNVNERLHNMYHESRGVVIESLEGQGTSFILRFPRNRSEIKYEIEDNYR